MRMSEKGGELPQKAAKAVTEFVTLVHADWRRKHEQAVSAREALRGLGVHIRFGPAWRSNEAQAAGGVR